MNPEVQEVELDLNEANATQESIYKEQQKAGWTADDETVKISEEALTQDAKWHNERNPLVNPGENMVIKDNSFGEDTTEKPQEEEKQPEKTPQEILADLGLKHEPKVRRIADADNNSREYVQKPLSFVGKIQFLSYVGEVLDKAMSGANKLQLGSLFDVPVRGEVLTAQDFSDAETFVQAVGKLLIYAPDFLSKSYCIWLRIPEYERDWAVQAMEENLSDEDGWDIIETFIDQNWETLQGFFSEKLPSLSKRLQARYRASQSDQ